GSPTSSFGYQDKSGAIWFNTSSVLVQLTADGKSILHAVPHRYAGEWARRAYEDSHGNFWLGTTTGLYIVVGENKITPVGIKGGPGRSQVSCICEDGQGRVWVATEPAGLFQIKLNPAEGAAGEATAIAYNPPGAPAANYIDCMFRDRENTMWVGTAYYG